MILQDEKLVSVSHFLISKELPKMLQKFYNSYLIRLQYSITKYSFILVAKKCHNLWECIWISQNAHFIKR